MPPRRLHESVAAGPSAGHEAGMPLTIAEGMGQEVKERRKGSERYESR